MAEIVITRTSLEDIGAEAWDSLAAVNSVHTIFQSYAWNTAWWQVHSSQHELVLIEARQAGRLVGIAPFVIDGAGVLRFLGYGASDYLDLLVEPDRQDVLAMLARGLLQLKWKRMLLEQVHQDSVLVKCGWAVPSHVEVQKPAPSYRFAHDDSDLRLPNKKSLRRHYNYFQRKGALSFEVLQQADDVSTHLDQFFEQHIARRELTAAPSRFLDSREREFYRSLTEKLSATGHLRFCVLRFNDEVLAYHFGFEFNRALYWYKPTFNVKYEKQSPGEVLLKLMLEDCIARNLDELDFTIGKESFKYRFANQERFVFRIVGFHSRPRLVLERSARELIKRMRTLKRVLATLTHSVRNPTRT